MNTPKMSRRKRDGIFMLTYYDGNERIRISLGIKNEIAARIKYTDLTGLSPQCQPALPVMIKAESYNPEYPTVEYVDAINEFMLSAYGIQNAWYAKRKPNVIKNLLNLWDYLNASRSSVKCTIWIK